MPDSKMKELNPSREPAWHERLNQGSSARTALIQQYQTATSETTERPQAQEAKNAFPRWRKGLLALAGTSLLLPALLSACGGGEKEGGVTVTTLIPTSTAAHETIEGGLPSAQTPIIETSTSSPSIEPTEPVPTETVLTPETQTVFDNLRTKITSLESTEQQELLIFINHFEQTESVLNKFKIAYEANKNQILALQKTKFGALSKFYPENFASEEEFLVSQLPFMYDLQRLEAQKATFNQLVNFPPEEIAQKLRSLYEEFFRPSDPISNRLFYTESRPPILDLTIDRSSIEPGYQFQEGFGFRTVEESEARVRELVGELPLFGKYNFTLVKRSFGQFHSELANPVNELEVGIDSMPLSMDIDTLHEIAHSLDPKVNLPRHIIYINDPGKILQLIIEAESALRDPQWGQNFPDLQKVFSPEKENMYFDPTLTKQEQYSPADFAAIAGNHADTIWLSQAGFGTGIEKPILDSFLATDTFQQFANEATSKPDMYYQNPEDFFQKERGNLDQLAQNPIWHYALDKLKPLVPYLKNVHWIDSPYVIYGYKLPESHWQALITYARAAIAKGLYEDDSEAWGLFSRDQQRIIAQNLQKVARRAADEEFASRIAYGVYLSKSDKLAGWGNSPYSVFLKHLEATIVSLQESNTR